MLVPNYSFSNPAAVDLKVIHPLNTDLILGASLASGNSAEVGEIENMSRMIRCVQGCAGHAFH